MFLDISASFSSTSCMFFMLPRKIFKYCIKIFHFCQQHVIFIKKTSYGIIVTIFERKKKQFINNIPKRWINHKSLSFLKISCYCLQRNWLQGHKVQCYLSKIMQQLLQLLSQPDQVDWQLLHLFLIFQIISIIFVGIIIHFIFLMS